MAKKFKGILFFSLLALGILLFGCTQPAEPAAPARDGAGEVAPAEEERIVAAEAPSLNPCNLLTLEEVASACNLLGVTLVEKLENQYDGGPYNTCYYVADNPSETVHLYIGAIAPDTYRIATGQNAADYLRSRSSNQKYFKEDDLEVAGIGDYALAPQGKTERGGESFSSLLFAKGYNYYTITRGPDGCAADFKQLAQLILTRAPE